jgi:hypothetical protein
MPNPQGDHAKWWVVETRGYIRPWVYIGRVFATAEQIREAVGPYVELEGNTARVFDPSMARGLAKETTR